MLRGYQLAGQRGTQVYLENREPRVCCSLHRRDVPQVGRLRPLQILLQRVDLSRLRHCLRKFFYSLQAKVPSLACESLKIIFYKSDWKKIFLEFFSLRYPQG